MAKIHVHFLGIGGSGASAAAAIAQAQGYAVSGCDLEPNNEFTLHIRCVKLKGHNPKHLNAQTGFGNSNVDIDILAVTPAIFSLDPRNPELVEAKQKGIPIMTWQQFMGKYLTKDKFVIAIAGTHGKTTTTSMIAKLLEDAGLNPTVLLGAIAPWWGTNYRIPTRHPELDSGSIQNRFRIKSGMTRREYFVVEADEFNNNFLSLTPDISVVTNIEMDHPEYFKNFNHYKNSFKKFLSQTKGKVVANLSDPGIKAVIADPVGLTHPTYGVEIVDYSQHLIDSKLHIPGGFNRWNASAAYQVGLLLGIKTQTIQKSLTSYKGIDRRFEYIGNYHGAEVYSDFGHHPTEIKTTMEAAREKFPKSRIWLIYEPHMFTRTKFLFNDFVKVFKELPVDKIIITDIYQSREVDTGLVSSQQLVNAAATHHDTLVYHNKVDLKGMLKKHIQKGDIIFFMGAGDIDKIARNLVVDR